MANPSGVNESGSLYVPYGDVKRMQELTRAAPMSGAPLAGAAAAAPVRDQRAAVRGTTPSMSQASVAVPPVAQAPVTVPGPTQIAMAWQQIAAVPGASPLVKQYAADAARAAGM